MTEAKLKFEPKDGEWYNIPRYPQFKINRQSQIKLANSGELARVYRACKRNNRKRMVVAVNGTKKSKRMVFVSELVKHAFYDEQFWNYVAVHKDGDNSNDSIENIILLDRTMFARRRLDKQNKPWIVRIDMEGNVIQRFPTVKCAARECFLSATHIRNRCNRRVIREFDYDDTTFRYEGEAV